MTDEQVRSVQVAVRGYCFDALEAGPPDGELVVALHGFPQTSQCWRAVFPRLAAAGYHVVAPDQRGYSPGARPEQLEAYRTVELVADVLALADHFGVPCFHVVGHDWGALVAWQLAGRHPARVRSLTALSVPHPGAMVQAVQPDSGSDQAQRSSYVEIFRQEGAEVGMLAHDAAGLRLIYLGAGLSEAESAPYLEAVGNQETLRAALSWYRAAELADIEDLGPAVAPTLFVWSTEDPAISRGAAERCAAFVDGPYRFEVLEGISHWIPEHAPGPLGDLLVEHLASAAA